MQFKCCSRKCLVGRRESKAFFVDYCVSGVFLLKLICGHLGFSFLWQNLRNWIKARRVAAMTSIGTGVDFTGPERILSLYCDGNVQI